ncbi:DNA-directed primase/polymerase protein-like isoform X2 [Paramacrobiotus metropolitanus]|uniref:DNA-directed primase/polymerase protein-like isoform X2 n=1 Tax=Paramacrobiotus metropolitanus TaxID=2943436 RepID=UPI0024456F9A|nr:DNA-directed primase/polymerase protein-like isoform X2 [Paramacrobiotus metropolitanus]
MLYFHKLAPALSYLRTTEEYRIYAQELSLTDTRQFIVCSVSDIWTLINATDSCSRNFYEVIPEFYTAKLYTDLEFLKTQNPTITLTKLIPLLIEKINDIFGNDEVIVLDSTSEFKESFHLVWPKILKPYNKLFKSIMQPISELPEFQVVDKYGRFTSCIDMNVYNTNQNFRLLNCSKKGKFAFLTKSSLTSKSYLPLSNEIFFEMSLVCSYPVRTAPNFFSSDYCQQPTKHTTESRTSICKRGAPNAVLTTIVSLILCRWDEAFLTQNNMLFDYNLHTQIILIILKCRYCVSQRKQHDKNHTYLIYKKNSSSVQLRCHDTSCKDLARSKGWPAIQLLRTEYIDLNNGIISLETRKLRDLSKKMDENVEEPPDSPLEKNHLHVDVDDHLPDQQTSFLQAIIQGEHILDCKVILHKRKIMDAWLLTVQDAKVMTSGVLVGQTFSNIIQELQLPAAATLCKITLIHATSDRLVRCSSAKGVRIRCPRSTVVTSPSGSVTRTKPKEHKREKSPIRSVAGYHFQRPDARQRIRISAGR